MATDKDILQDAQEKFEESQDGSDFNREEAYEDISFARMSDQWPEKIKKQRQKEGRPCLTINRLPSFIHQVVNDSRQNKPGIVVGPVDGGADEETAHVIGGLIRSIERGSNAEIAYDTAIEHAVSGGFGFFRIGIDYVHPESFEMEARIERIPNPLMVNWDVNSTQFDASDWDYGFVSEFLTEDEFEVRYPGAQKADFETDPRDGTSYWLQDDKIRVAEYWCKEEEKKEIVLLSDGRVIHADEMGKFARDLLEFAGMDMGSVKDDEAIQAAMAATGIDEVRRRETIAHKVTRYIVSGAEVLETDPWPGQTIPICPVWGEEVYLDGRRHFRSMIRDARDPQQMFNFWRSATTELVALAPKAPWVGPKGFVPKGQEQVWETANNRSYSYLEYEGQTAPQRTPFAGVPAGALQEALSAQDDMKAIIGIYDASLGARSNETSGRAIMARQRESDVANFHFIDNLSRAVRYAGRVLVDIIPSVYSARETIRILGEDQSEKVAQLTQQGTTEINPETGQPELYNLAVGHYDVTVKAGPSYSTQREEAREVLIEIMRNVPGAAPYIGDILADHLDFVGADKLKDRLKMLLPPQIQQAEAMENGEAPPQGMPVDPAMQGQPVGPEQPNADPMQALGELLKGNQELMQGMVAAIQTLNAPKEIIRDAGGRPVGVQPVQPELPLTG